MSAVATPLPTMNDQLALPRRPWVAILANPFSGAGRNLRRVHELEAALRRHDLQPLVITDRAARARVLADAALPEHCRCLVVAGGDGTVGDVINDRGEAASDVPLAVLPLGNENLLAKHLGFAIEPARLGEAIMRGDFRRVDLGLARLPCDAPRANGEEAERFAGCPGAAGRRFSLMLSAGLDADVVHRLARWRCAGGTTRRVRHWSYARPLVEALGFYPYGQVELQTDEGDTARGAHALVFNMPRYGLNLPFAPDAGCDDGLLDWVVFERHGALTSVGYLWSVLRGQHLSRPDVRHGKSAGLTIRGEEVVPVQMDGDPAGCTPVRVEVIREGLRVVVA